jgi:hypothetical protein
MKRVFPQMFAVVLGVACFISGAGFGLLLLWTILPVSLPGRYYRYYHRGTTICALPASS